MLADKLAAAADRAALLEGKPAGGKPAGGKLAGGKLAVDTPVVGNLAVDKLAGDNPAEDSRAVAEPEVVAVDGRHWAALLVDTDPESTCNTSFPQLALGRKTNGLQHGASRFAKRTIPAWRR